MSPTVAYAFDLLQSWSGFYKWGNYDTIAIVEVLGEPFTNTIYMDAFDDDEVNEAFGTQRIEGVFIPARIVEIIGGNSSLTQGDTVSMGFGSTWIIPLKTLEPYKIGEQYVCFMSDFRDLPYEVENCYGVSKYSTLYIADDKTVLPMTGLIKCLNECEGMSLKDFTKLANKEYREAHQ